MNAWARLVAAALSFSLAGACAPAGPPPTAPPRLTPLPPAVATPAPTAPPTFTAAPPTPPRATLVQPSEAAPATLTPTPTSAVTAAPCVNAAEFTADLTAPDGAQYLPGQVFVKQWSVQNTGTCDWGPGYRLVFLSGDPLTAAPGAAAQTEFALYPARAGAPAVWEIPMRAPDAPGEYLGRWQARDPAGNLFGGVVYVTIEVIPLPGADTPTPAP